uniref:CDC42 effector protein (Rho GTPase binding) 2 n=1 Tax=Callorhinchus milii TaxID=7868 RepID=A0A4W3GDR8_CALMI
MAAKAPVYLKRRKGKRERLRDILSADMISPPLGDFRHAVHIGSGEDDVFGDLSFLEGQFHLLPGNRAGPPARGPPYALSRTASARAGGARPAEATSPLLKSAISLPLVGGGGGCASPHALALTLPLLQPHPSAQAQAPPPKPPRLHLDEQPLAPAEKGSDRVGRAGENLRDTGRVGGSLSEEGFLTHAGSLLSLHLDLGPSILDDVLEIMDRR